MAAKPHYQRRQYREIAEIFATQKQAIERAQWEAMRADFVRMFAADNSRFDRDTFLTETEVAVHEHDGAIGWRARCTRRTP